MQIYIIAVGNKMPIWVQQGYEDYTKRLPREFEIILKEIVPAKRGKNSDLARIIKDEADKTVSAIPAGAYIVTLDIAGKPWTTEDLSVAVQKWQASGQPVALLVG